MQFTQVTVLVSTVEVINTVSDVGSLLYFCQEASGSNAVDTSCRQEEYIARLYVIFVEGITNCIVFNHVGIFLRSNLFFQTRIQVCLSAGIVDDIPHFCFTHRLVALHGQFIVRVYLNRQILLGVNKLDKQRELALESLVVFFSYQLSFIFFHQLSQVLAGICTFCYYRFVARYV